MSTGTGFPHDPTWFASRFEDLSHNIETFIRGKADVVRAALVCVFAEGHLLVEDVPGVGKTSLAKALANSIDARMRRIQFTPDLLPTDVTGVEIFDEERRFRFRKGPVFANVVLADEINRASPKTQSALLEVMEERQVTMGGQTYGLERPFLVIATSNPKDHEGVYRLPEAQLDRFLMRIEMGYPAAEAERAVMGGHLEGRSTSELHPVLSLDEVQDMIATARTIPVTEALQGYIVDVVAATRRRDECRLGVSPRGSLGLAVAARAMAAAEGERYVTARHVKRVAPHVLAHRMILRPDAEHAGYGAADLVDEILAETPVPRVRAA